MEFVEFSERRFTDYRYATSCRSRKLHS